MPLYRNKARTLSSRSGLVSVSRLKTRHNLVKVIRVTPTTSRGEMRNDIQASSGTSESSSRLKLLSLTETIDSEFCNSHESIPKGFPGNWKLDSEAMSGDDDFHKKVE